MERYRSGHNEAVLKTVCPKGRVGSNPTLSACFSRQTPNREKYSRGQRGAPAKGVGRVTDARVQISPSPFRCGFAKR